MKGDTARKLIAGLAAAALLLFLMFSIREYGAAWYAETQTRRGVAVFEEGDIAGAERLFRQALRVNSKHAGAWLNLGAAAQVRGKHHDAIDAYKRAIDLATGHEAVKSARLGLASVYADRSIEPPAREMDWFAKAVEQYQRLAEMEPENPEYPLLAGMTAFAAGNPGLGLQELRKASELADEPGEMWVHSQLLEFYTNANLREDADREMKTIEGFSGGGGEPVKDE